MIDIRSNVHNFNSTKVQFGVVTGDFKETLTHISIPLRYNLETDLL